MGIEVRSINIESDVYSITTFPTTKGVGYIKRITKLIGPSLTALQEGDKENSSEGALTVAVKLLCENLDKDDIAQLIKDLLQSLRKNDVPVTNFDNEFAANYGTLMKLIVFVIQENFGSFFVQLGIGNGQVQ